MITVSLVREIQFLSKYFKAKTSCEVKIGDLSPITFLIKEDVVSVFFLNENIWQESLSKSSNFGVESCDTILKIMKLVQDGKDWSMYPHIHLSA